MKNKTESQEKWSKQKKKRSRMRVPGFVTKDFDKLKQFFYSGIHITMLISLFVCNRQTGRNGQIKIYFLLPNGRKKESNRKKKSSKNMSQIT